MNWQPCSAVRWPFPLKRWMGLSDERYVRNVVNCCLNSAGGN